MITEETFYNAYKMNLVEKFISYVIDSKYRKAVELRPWLEKQVKNRSKLLQFYAKLIPTKRHYESQIIEILKYVRKKITYKTDQEQWGMAEKWESAEEVLKNRFADCESGSVLIYILARLKGIPANRLMLIAGWVKSSPNASKGGHAWLGFRTNYYGCYSFIDWCYFPNNKAMKYRNSFYIQKKKILEFSALNDLKVESRYKSIWFMFSEDISTNKT